MSSPISDERRCAAVALVGIVLAIVIGCSGRHFNAGPGDRVIALLEKSVALTHRLDPLGVFEFLFEGARVGVDGCQERGVGLLVPKLRRSNRHGGPPTPFDSKDFGDGLAGLVPAAPSGHVHAQHLLHRED